MKKTTRKLISLLCALALVVGLVPATAGAAELMLDERAEVPVWETGVMPAPELGEAVTAAETVELPEFPELPEEEDGAELLADNWVHDFTANGKTSTFYSITGNLASNKGTATYDGKTLTQCLKIETATDITFTAPEKGTLTLVFGSSETGNIKLDGTKMTSTGNVLTLDVTMGSHTLKKADTRNLFYMVYATAHTHKWSDWTETKKATCTEKGQETRTCSEPGCSVKTETRDIPMLPHTPVDVPAKPATCVTDGTTAGTKCSVCQVILTGCDVIKATGQHDFSEGNTCKNCGVTQHEHAWGNAEVLTPATCTQPGVRLLHCTADAKCEETKRETIPALNHDLSVTVPAQEPTCTAAGWDAYQKCSRCDYNTKVEKKALGHTPGSDGKTCERCGNVISEPLDGAGGWFETMFVETNQFSPTDVTAVKWVGSSNGKLDRDGLKYLVRAGLNGGKTRIDVPGVKAGEYTLTVVAKGTSYQAKVNVDAYDRSGYAHWNYTQGIGAYRDDGVLKENAIVLYVNESNKDTVTVESGDGTTVTGIGHILNTAGKDVGGGVTDKGGIANNNQGILKKLSEDDTPLVVRIIDDVTTPDGVTAYDSPDYGGSTGDNGYMVRMKDARNVTIEGIGPNASLNGWGIHFMASSGYQEGGKSFEARNLAFRNVPEDCLGMEGVQQDTPPKLLASVERVWVHNCSFYVPKISNPAESDKGEGDGACDFKRGQYMTMSYCYFKGYHKTNLMGAKDNNLQYNITWHHNWWEGCESRGPLNRNANVHIYNCIYDGNSSYTQNTRANGYIFSEYNTFLGCKDPGLVEGGAIKSWQDNFIGCQWKSNKPATVVSSKDQVVTSGNLYESFELHKDESYIPDGDYQLDITAEGYTSKIKAYAGPMKADVIGPEDVTTSLVPDDRTPTAYVALPYDKATNKTTVPGTGKQVLDNIVFVNSKTAATDITLGGDAIGRYVVFKVNEPVDITLTDGGGSYQVILISAGGTVLVTGSGTASNCPAGTYFIESSFFDPGTGKYKEAKLAHLTIKKAASPTPPHEHSFTNYVQTVAPTCTKEGTKLATCSCGKATDRQSIPMLGHTWVNGVCTVCGATEATLGEVDPDAPEVAVTDLILDPETSTTVMEKSTTQVTATVLPSNATDKSVEWTTSDPLIATVAKNGTITGKGAGTAIITATAASGVSKTVTVTVIGVDSKTYTFAANAEGPNPVTSDNPGPALADGSKWGKDGELANVEYFTNVGTGNTWKAKNWKSGDKTPGSVWLAQGGASSFRFTVSEGATARVTINYSSTGDDNRSAIALVGPGGDYVTSTQGTNKAICLGKSTATVIYENLSAGTYAIQTPANVLPSDVNPDWDGFAADADNPNKRSAQLIRVAVAEDKPVDPSAVVDVTEIVLKNQAGEIIHSGTLEVGQTKTIFATPLPSNATNKNIRWESSNESVATVSKGTVTGRGVGNATITARCFCGKVTATVAVTVTPATRVPVPVSSISITGPSTAVTVDGSVEKTIQLVQHVLPDDADNKTLTWTSDSDAKGVSVSSGGRVTVAANAQSCTATITATATDGSGVKGTYKVTVTAAGRVEVTDINIMLNGTHTTATDVNLSGTLTLTAAVEAEAFNGATVTEADRAVNWSSSNENIATVENGVVTAVGVGTVTITAESAKDPDISEDLVLTVQANIMDGTPRDLGWGYNDTSRQLIVTGMTAEDTVLAATYDANGRFSGVVELTAAKFTAEVAKTAARIKLFWVNQGEQPMCEEAIVK